MFPIMQKEGAFGAGRGDKEDGEKLRLGVTRERLGAGKLRHRRKRDSDDAFVFSEWQRRNGGKERGKSECAGKDVRGLSDEWR